jgi:hypothetical protein
MLISTMKVVLSAILFALVVVGGYTLVTRLPWIQVYRGCYQTAYSIYNQEHSISRRAWTTDEQICIEHKNTLLSALNCFASAESQQPLNTLEKDLILVTAQNLAKGTEDMNQVISGHNKRCTYRKSTLNFDAHTNSWF